MAVTELIREQQTNIQYEPLRVMEEPSSTRRIGRALGYALASHRSGAFELVGEDTKRDMLGKLNWPISQGDTLVEIALGSFHSHLFAQIGRRKTADVNIIHSIVELVQGKNMAIATVEAPALVQGRSLYIPDRGIFVELPPNCAEGIDICPETGKVNIDPLVRIHLKAIQDDPIIESRFPSAKEGEKFMDGISPQWRDRLLEYAEDIINSIKQTCWAVGRERFSIVLYGSLARNLSKHRTHEDPSNIDLVVIGQFSNQQRLDILDGIRNTRQQTTTEIKAAELCRCNTIRCQCYNETANRYWYSSARDLRNSYGEITNLHSGFIERAGVVIQTPETTRSNGYSDARRYISSCAKALYDPENIWQEIENEALVYSQIPPLVKKKIRNGKAVGYFLRKVTASLNDSAHFQKDRGVIDRVIQSLQTRL